MKKVPNLMGEKKISFTDLTSGDPQGLMKTYNLSSRQLEQQALLHGGRDIPQRERKQLYHDIYDKHRGRGGFK